MSVLEDRGYFWWSEEAAQPGRFAPDTAVSGTLKIRDDGTSHLELDGFLGSLTEGVTGLLDYGANVGDISGFLKNRNCQVLLCGVSTAGGRFSSRGVSYPSYLALDCLVGQDPEGGKIDPTALNFVEVDLDGLEDWLRLASIKGKETKTGSVTIKFKKQRSAAYKVGNERLQFIYGFERPYLGAGGYNAINIRETARIRVSSRRRFELDEARRKFYSLSNLLSLLTGLNVRLAWPRLGNSTKKLTCTLYSRGLQPTGPADSVSQQKCWFPYPSISQDFGSLYENWRSKSDEFGPGFYICLGSKRQSTIYVESRFGNLISGLESFHRTKFPSRNNAGLSAKVGRILQSVLPKDRRWLKQRLAYADEPSLADRIMEIIEQLPLGLDTKLVSAFAKGCADSRNELSHFAGKRKSAQYDRFVDLLTSQTDALMNLYALAILHEIGVPSELLAARVREGYVGNRIMRSFSEVGLIPS